MSNTQLVILIWFAVAVCALAFNRGASPRIDPHEREIARRKAAIQWPIDYKHPGD